MRYVGYFGRTVGWILATLLVTVGEILALLGKVAIRIGERLGKGL